MQDRLLADAVLVAHLGFVLFAVLGGLLALRWRYAPVLHLPALAWAAFIEVTGGVCPLTHLEVSLRRAAGASGYSGGFVEHHLVPILYPPGLSPPTQLGLAAALLLVNLVVYGWVWRRRVHTASLRADRMQRREKAR